MLPLQHLESIHPMNPLSKIDSRRYFGQTIQAQHCGCQCQCEYDSSRNKG